MEFTKSHAKIIKIWSFQFNNTDKNYIKLHTLHTVRIFIELDELYKSLMPDLDSIYNVTQAQKTF